MDAGALPDLSRRTRADCLSEGTPPKSPSADPGALRDRQDVRRRDRADRRRFRAPARRGARPGRRERRRQVDPDEDRRRRASGLRRAHAHRRAAGAFPLRPRRARRRHRHGPPGAVDRPVLERGRERVPGPPAGQRGWHRRLAAHGARGAGRTCSGWASTSTPRTDAAACPSGLQQLVELGRVLFSGARIIILDEPTSALSPPEIERLFGVLRRLKARGHAASSSSRTSSRTCSTVSDTVTVFRNGRKIATADAADVDKHWLIERMIGRGHEELEEARGEITLASRPDAAGGAGDRTGSAARAPSPTCRSTVRAGEVLGCTASWAPASSSSPRR